MIPKELFLSHSSQDHLKVEEVAETLRNHGIPTWFSSTNIMGAQQWHDEIGNALKRCDWFIILLSPGSVHSRWVKSELVYALNHNQYENHILPVVIEDCNYEDLSWTLGMFEMISLKANKIEGYRNLLRTWGIGYREV